MLVESVKTQNSVRTRRALELNAAGDFAAAGALMRQNADFSRAVQAEFSSSFEAAPEAAAAIAAEESWNERNESSVSSAPADARVSRKIRARAHQVETQQSTSQEGL